MPPIEVRGMHCNNCRNAVAKALENMPELVNVKVDLTFGRASWDDKNPDAPMNVEKVKDAVRGIGFEA